MGEDHKIFGGGGGLGGWGEWREGGHHRKFIADCLLLREGGGNQVKFSVIQPKIRRTVPH